MSDVDGLTAPALQNIEENLRTWDHSYAWSDDGDEWRGQAQACGVPYGTWKQSLVDHLITPYVKGAVALEIAPGHGRWTEHLLAAKRLTLVDLSPSCLEFCRKRFGAPAHLDDWLTSGAALPPEASGSLDLVWSFDAFVHMHPDVVAGYLREIARVLTAGGRAVIHHADVADPATHQPSRSKGWRSAVSAGMVAEMAAAAGLGVERQALFWDEARRIGVPNNGDKVSWLRKP